MTIKSLCEQCGIEIEFEAEMANQSGACPACGKTTRLMVPGSRAHAQTEHAVNILKGRSGASKRRPVEEHLEAVGNVMLFLGLLGAIGIVGIAVISILIGTDENVAVIVGCIPAAVASFVPFFILKVLFYALAEIIRLLRAIANKP